MNFRFDRLVKLGVIVLVIASAAAFVAAQDTDTEALIANAMSAAPASIGENATIAANEVDADGKPIILREGTNGWVCYPDLPGTPGNDPACQDATWEVWSAAFGAGEEPVITTTGIAYMLQGGSEASMDEPLAEAPAGEDWVASPPHIMLILPNAEEYALYPTDHTLGQPYVMWADTPYRHIMIPVDMDAMAHE